MNKFKCLKCGKCCHNVILKGYERYIPIYLDEIHKYTKMAEEKNLNLHLEPDLLYPDVINKKLIIVTYVFKFKDVCVFYKENFGCTIYKDRPITCKAYPVSIWTDHKKSPLDPILTVPIYLMSVNVDCKFVEQESHLVHMKNYMELKDFFPDEYNQAMKLMIKGKEILYRLIELETQKKIDVGYLSGKLDFFYDVEKAEVEYKNWEKINLYDIKLD
ncbi:MAG: YkgJ family cysteine cluster protein [Candidatus Hodarchaeota archaeon]